MKTKFIVTCLLAAALTASARQELFYVGSGRADIEAFLLDDSSGAIVPLGKAARISAPSFLAFSPGRHFLYSVTEGRTPEESSASGFAVSADDGKLTFLNRQPTRGGGPCFIEVDQSGRDALVANYNTGSVTVFPIDAQGQLGEASAFVQDSGSSVNRSRQEGPHAHCIVTDPRDRFVYVCDLGTDKIMIYRFHPEKGTLTPARPAFISVAPGAGPRHIAFHPSGRWAYVTGEMSSTVTAYACDSRHGTLTLLQTLSLLPANFSGFNTAAEVEVDKAGRNVYCSNRGDNSIVQFRCDRETGKLTYVDRAGCGGKTPRQFMIDPSGRFLLVANQDSNSVAEFRIDKETGQINPTGIVLQSDVPECVQFR